MLARKALAGTAAAPKVYVEDVFSSYLYTGTGANLTINNGIALGSSYGGSVYFDSSGDRIVSAANTALQLTTSDFTVEFWAYRNSSAGTAMQIGSGTEDWSPVIGYPSGSNLVVYLSSNGSAWDIASGQILGSITNGVWTHYALTRSGSTFKTFKDGTLVSTFTSSSSIYQDSNQFCIGRAQNSGTSFDGYISNLRLVKGTALYTSAFTPSTTPLTAVSGTSILVCQSPSATTDYSSNALSITVTGAIGQNGGGPFTDNDAGKGGLVWIKGRPVTRSHHLVDTERGATKRLLSNATNAEASSSDSVLSFSSTGFSLGADTTTLQVNNSAENYVSWTFRKAKKFFDVVKYAGTGSSKTVSHNLGSTPGCIIVKRLGSAENWAVWHRGLSAGYWI
jgi:hypothetical protein